MNNNGMNLPAGSPGIPFALDVARSFHQHAAPGEFITTHGIDNHGGHGSVPHVQITLVNREAHRAFPIRLNTPGY
jgi:hypothetical protein